MKQWLCLFLIILFSFQVLPVKALGKLFMKKNLTEQVQDESSSNTDVSKQSMEKEFDKLCIRVPAFRLTALIIEEQVKVALHNLPFFEDHFLPDIPTPPPDIARS